MPPGLPAALPSCGLRSNTGLSAVNTTAVTAYSRVALTVDQEVELLADGDGVAAWNPVVGEAGEHSRVRRRYVDQKERGAVAGPLQSRPRFWTEWSAEDKWSKRLEVFLALQN